MRAPGSPLHQLMRELDAGLFELGVSGAQPHGIGFGSQLDATRDIGGLTDVLSWKATKTASCLALPLKQEASGDKATLMLLLTDGVADSDDRACGPTCAAGNDTTCVAEAIYGYLARGSGLWVVGLRAPFKGKYFSAQSHGAIQVSKGVRPLYVWIGSPDVDVGRRLAERVAAKLSGALGSVGGVDSVLTFEVWPGAWRGRGAPPRDGLVKAAQFRVSSAAAAALQCGDDAVGIDGLAQEDWPRLTLKPRGATSTPAGAVWSLRLPLAEAPSGGLPRRTLLTLDARMKTALELDLRGHGVQVVRSKAVEATALSLCLRAQAAQGYLTAAWTPTTHPEILTAWSTDDDTSLATIARTLGFASLWSQVAERLERETRNLETVLLGFKTRGMPGARKPR